MTFIPNIGSLGSSRTDIISKLLEKKIVLLTGTVDQMLSTTICAQLMLLDNLDDKPISIYINTYGGCVYSGLAIFDTIKHVKCTVNTICVGSAFSMGSVILASGSKRYATKHSRIMIHQTSSTQSPQTRKAYDYLVQQQELVFLNEQFIDILTESTRGKIERDHMKDILLKESYMTPEEALNVGIIDEII